MPASAVAVVVSCAFDTEPILPVTGFDAFSIIAMPKLPRCFLGNIFVNGLQDALRTHIDGSLSGHGFGIGNNVGKDKAGMNEAHGHLGWCILVLAQGFGQIVTE